MMMVYLAPSFYIRLDLRKVSKCPTTSSVVSDPWSRVSILTAGSSGGSDAWLIDASRSMPSTRLSVFWSPTTTTGGHGSRYGGDSCWPRQRKRWMQRQNGQHRGCSFTATPLEESTLHQPFGLLGGGGDGWARNVRPRLEKGRATSEGQCEGARCISWRRLLLRRRRSVSASSLWRVTKCDLGAAPNLLLGRNQELDVAPNRLRGRRQKLYSHRTAITQPLAGHLALRIPLRCRPTCLSLRSICLSSPAASPRSARQSSVGVREALF